MPVASWFAALLTLLVALAQPALAAPARTENVETELHAALSAAAPGARVDLALRQNIREGWHTYWSNPGDSGEPTEVIWAAPAGVVVGPLQFPAPEAIPFDILVNYGYSGEILFPIALDVPASARPGETLTLRADVTWLVCSDICIPENATLSLVLPIAAASVEDAVWAPRIAAARAALPSPEPALQARISAGAPARISFAGPPVAGVRAAHFFPYRGDVIDHAAPTNLTIGPEGIGLDLKAGAAGALGQDALEGVLTVTRADGARAAYAVRAEPGPPLPGTGASGAALAAGALTLPLALALAFVGGLILNVMPCVFPVLSLKALHLAKIGAGDARRTGVFFTAGVVAAFLALAGALIALKAGGAAVGWGFQLQSPLMIAALSALFFLIALNLLGVFEIGGSLQNVGGGLAARGGDAGSFFTGALAVVAATPCTAPFMASATGFAVTQPWYVTLLVFAVLALGFAAPFALLAFAPALRRFLPKPGPWMTRARTLLAFPMFATVAWLAWVLTAQTGPNGLLALLALLTALAFAVTVARWGPRWGVAGAAIALVVVALAARPLIAPPTPTQTAAISEEAWSPARVAALRAEGKGVFVDFTAAWCVTCQVNKLTVFQRARVREAFAANDVVFLTADWTNPDSDIAAALAAYGRDGVPLYLFYAPGAAEARVLPQVLTEDFIINAITIEERTT